jgi:uncharacterized protein involved in exopolysaccharide biosynthesis
MAGPVQIRHEATLRDFLNVFFRWKYLIFSIFFLTTAVIIYARASKPLVYVASSRLLVARGERPSIFATMPRYLNWAEEMSSQLEVILSEAVFSRARKVFADSLEARGGPRSLVFNPGAVRAEVVGESNVVAISYAGLDPVACELGCAAVTYAYIDYYQQATAPPEVDDFFDAEIDATLAEIAQWRQRKSDFLGKEEYVGVDEAGKHMMFKLSHFETEAASLSGEMSSARSDLDKLALLVALPLEELEQRLSATSTDSPVQSRALGDIRLELQRLKTRREELLALYTERHPDVIAVDNQMADLKRQLKQEVENAYELANAEYLAKSARFEVLRGEIVRTQAEIAALPEKEKELARIESNITSNEKKYEILIGKRHEAAIAVATSEDFEVTVLNPPGRATARRTGDYVRLAVGPFLSFIVGLGLAFFLESMDHSVKSAAEVEQYLGARLLATVSEVRRKG